METTNTAFDAEGDAAKKKVLGDKKKEISDKIKDLEDMKKAADVSFAKAN